MWVPAGDVSSPYTFGSLVLPKCSTHLADGNVHLIKKREIKQFLGLDLLFLKDLLAIFFHCSELGMNSTL